MTNSDIVGLAERCEKVAGPDRELSASIALAVHDWLHEVGGNKPLNCRVRNKLGSPIYIGGEVGRAMDYTASLDAAMALVPEGLTWFVSTDFVPVSAGIYNGADDDDGLPAFSGDAPTPALALCAAALRARASTQKEAR